mmetsp:Transcript_87404/g.225126  ORF Transcript_87404/g.225126 Transcript_87404/m.225126 type:complete len:182 (-) Transcript_87404:261-806(-)
MANAAPSAQLSAASWRRRARTQPCLLAVLLASALVAAAVAPMCAQSRVPPRGTKPPNFTPAKRTQRLQQTFAPTGPEAPAWLQSLFGDLSSKTPSETPSQELALSAATKLLMAMGSVVGAVQLADGAGLIYAADVLDVLDAQAIISEGQASLAEINLDDNLVNLRLWLQDGTDHIITLFTK